MTVGFELLPGESVPQGIRRIAREQIVDASERLSDGDDPGKAVHGARKNFKRLRSVLRLAAEPLDRDVRKRENGVIREAGKRLSGARDSQVMLETLEALTQRYGLTANGFRAHLAAQHERAQADLRAARGRHDEVARALHEAELRVVTWTFSGTDEQQRLTLGLGQIYRRGRRCYRGARRKPTAENLHEWRKRAKDLWYGAQIMRPLAPRSMEKLAARAHHLADLLGDDHDLAVLRKEALVRAAPESRAELLELIDQRSAELRHEAFAIGRQLYRRKGAKFERWVQRG
ncbi:MAG: CHAD domain-containing protein [Solirubrobacteraceae bacterium]